MDFIKSLAIAASELRAQASRARTQSKSTGNADSAGQSAWADPYRRRIPPFRSETVSALGARLRQVRSDDGDF